MHVVECYALSLAQTNNGSYHFNCEGRKGNKKKMEAIRRCKSVRKRK